LTVANDAGPADDRKEDENPGNGPGKPHTGLPAVLAHVLLTPTAAGIT